MTIEHTVGGLGQNFERSRPRQDLQKENVVAHACGRLMKSYQIWYDIRGREGFSRSISPTHPGTKEHRVKVKKVNSTILSAALLGCLR